MHSEAAKIAETLRTESLTHLMLGHRELFHSNLLAWFFQYLPDAADRVFGSLTRSMVKEGGDAGCGEKSKTWI
jgi:hypothetical protein